MMAEAKLQSNKKKKVRAEEWFSHQDALQRLKKIEKVPTRNKSALLEIKYFKCGMIGHMAKQCMKKVNMKYFKCGKVGHYAWSCM